MALSEELTLDNTLGAAFIGNILAAILYGITCLQTFVYYKRSEKDHTAFKCVIYFLWILDSLHMALITHSLYFYLIKNYANPLALVSPNWSILFQVYLTCISDLIIRVIYGRRVWMISKSVVVAILVTLTSIAAFGAGFAFASRAFVEKTFANLSHISYLMYIALGSVVVADILIATSLCVSLSRSRTGFKRTDSMVNILMLYAINSSALTTLCAAACFITYTLWPMEFVFIGIYFCLSKLFLNSLLAMLNGRKGLKKDLSVMGGSTGFNFSQLSSRPTLPYNSESTVSKEGYALGDANPFRATQPMAITVNRQVVTDPEPSIASKEGYVSEDDTSFRAAQAMAITVNRHVVIDRRA